MVIAHTGWRRHTMKNRSCGLVQRIGTANSAAPHPNPCGGQAPALHFSVDDEMPVDIPARVTDTARPCRRPSLIGVRDMLTYQSPMPSAAGTPRYENWHRGLVEGLECDWSLESVPRSIHPHLNPLPSRARRKGAKAHFRTNRSCRLWPAHQGMKSWSCGLVRRIGTADSATPLLRPSGGQARALHSPSPPLWIPAFAGMTNRGPD